MAHLPMKMEGLQGVSFDSFCLCVTSSSSISAGCLDMLLEKEINSQPSRAGSEIEQLPSPALALVFTSVQHKHSCSINTILWLGNSVLEMCANVSFL